MNQEPNIYKVSSDLKNLGRNLDEFRNEVRKNNDMQLKILLELADYKRQTLSLVEQLNSMRDEMKLATAFRLKAAGALIVISALSTYLVSKLF